MLNDRHILYFVKPPLVENKKLTVLAYEVNSAGERVKFLSQYAGYYRSKGDAIALYPTYNKNAWEQNKARKHTISALLIRYI